MGSIPFQDALADAHGTIHLHLSSSSHVNTLMDFSVSTFDRLVFQTQKFIKLKRRKSQVSRWFVYPVLIIT